ncbi:hypothetical protein ANN_09623 [Periplaneta americana]|uniref:Reverse transcriptase domain-containing protein n=1 Tax=Periplaneta americana TaxID=6978 RepID=A0ABQ8TNX3_PERAM|nr:hypothetical protein ANN_09623 [Periplaneta americana]
MYLREMGYNGTDWINLTQGRDLWRAYVRAAMNLRVVYKPFVSAKIVNTILNDDDDDEDDDDDDDDEEEINYCISIDAKLLRTIGERYLEKNKEVYIVFVNLEKAFDRVDSNKLRGILKKIGVDWKERRKNNAETDQEEKEKLVGSLAEKKLRTEGCTERNGEREKSSG